MSASEEELLVNFAKVLAWNHSLNENDTHHIKDYAQVARFADVEQGLIGSDAYHNVMQHKSSLEDFLESYAQTSPHSNNRDMLSTWSYEFMTVHDYYCDERYDQGDFPQLDPDRNNILGDYVTLMIIYPRRLKNLFACYRDDIYEDSIPFYTDFVTPTVDRLTQEILDLFEEKKDNAAIVSKRQSIVDRVDTMLKKHFRSNQIRVEMFGSCANGLDTVDSDLDLCIIIPRSWLEHDANHGRLGLPKCLGSYFDMRFIAKKLRELGMTEVEPVPKAVVPICKFKDHRSGISCDVNTANDMGVENSKLIQAYTRIDSRVRPFLYAIKHFSKQRKINDASRGYLSSYSFVMMGLYYLMTCNQPVIPNLQTLGTCSVHDCRTKEPHYKLSVYKGDVEEFDVSFHTCVQATRTGNRDISFNPAATFWLQKNTETLGELLTGFFRYYAHTHDYYNTMITIYHGASCNIPRKWQRSFLVIQDPFIKNRNVSGSCKRDAFPEIKKEFARAYSSIKNNASFDHICLPYQEDRVQNHNPYNNRQRYRGWRSREDVRAAARNGMNRERHNGVQLSHVEEPHFVPGRRMPTTTNPVKSTMTASPFSSYNDYNDRVVQLLSPASASEPPVPAQSQPKNDNSIRIDHPNEYLVKFANMVPGVLDKKDYKDALSEYGRVIDIQTTKRSTAALLEDWYMRVVMDDPVRNPLPDRLDVYDTIQTIKSPSSSTDQQRSMSYTNATTVPEVNFLPMDAINNLALALQDMALNP